MSGVQWRWYRGTVRQINHTNTRTTVATTAAAAAAGAGATGVGSDAFQCQILAHVVHREVLIASER